MFKASVVYEANNEAKEDIVVNQGGTSSGKTYSIVQNLFTKAIEEPNVITVAAEDIPKLKAGALRDALDIYGNSQELQSLVASYNKTDRIFEFTNGSIMEFKSYQSAQDAKTGKRDYLFMNEANSFSYDVWEQLNLRTRKQSFIDYNPDAEFWVHEIVLREKSVRLIISDHRHNPFIPQKVHDKIEALKEKDHELWKVYARGLTGKIEGLIYRNYHLVDEVPKEAKRIAAGMDFGFTNDVTSTVDVFINNGELYIDELIYESGLTNPDISLKLSGINYSQSDEIVADSAEPKSIAELQNMGWNVQPAEKGPDSIKNGIDIIKRYKLNITRKSVNTRKEIGRYKWAVDQNGKTLNKPVDFMNHSMDALRYVGLNKLSEAAKGWYSVM